MTDEEKKEAEKIAKAIQDLQVKADSLEKAVGNHAAAVKSSEFQTFQERVLGDLDALSKAVSRSKVEAAADEVLAKAEKNMEVDIYLKSFAQSITRGVPGAVVPKRIQFTEAEKAFLQKADPHLSFNFTDGGALAAPPEMLMQLIDLQLREVSTITNKVTTYTTSTGSLVIPVQTAHTAVSWGIEGATAVRDKTAQFSQVRLNMAMRLMSFGLTYDMLEQPGLDLRALLLNDIARTQQISDGELIISGDGAGGKPVGLLNSSITFNYANQGEASTLTNGDALRKLPYNDTLKVASMARCVYVMKRSTMGLIAVLKGTDGQYLITRLPGATEMMLEGYPIVYADAMPAVGSNAYPVIFGDMAASYALVRRPTAFGLVVDTMSAAAAGIINYWVRDYLGGQPINPQAYIALKIAS